MVDKQKDVYNSIFGNFVILVSKYFLPPNIFGTIKTKLKNPPLLQIFWFYSVTMFSMHRTAKLFCFDLLFIKLLLKFIANTECDQGTFGADCKQTCHCGAGDTVCELDTGRCTSGGCANGWSGDNCQGNKWYYTGILLLLTMSIQNSLVASASCKGAERHIKTHACTRLSFKNMR